MYGSILCKWIKCHLYFGGEKLLSFFWLIFDVQFSIGFVIRLKDSAKLQHNLELHSFSVNPGIMLHFAHYVFVYYFLLRLPKCIFVIQREKESTRKKTFKIYWSPQSHQLTLMKSIWGSWIYTMNRTIGVNFLIFFRTFRNLLQFHFYWRDALDSVLEYLLYYLKWPDSNYRGLKTLICISIFVSSTTSKRLHRNCL